MIRQEMCQKVAKRNAAFGKQNEPAKQQFTYYFVRKKTLWCDLTRIVQKQIKYWQLITMVICIGSLFG